VPQIRLTEKFDVVETWFIAPKRCKALKFLRFKAPTMKRKNFRFFPSAFP
jgi:hypothetical protein